MDKMRWRYGDTNPVVAAVDAATVIEIGDLLYLDTDDVKPASQKADGACQTPPTTQRFAAKFLGVAMQRSRIGETDPVRVATTGVFEFDCKRDVFELGDLMGACLNDDANVLDRQRVTKVAAFGAEFAIARVARRESVATTSVLVDIKSTVMTGGILPPIMRS